MFKGVQILQVDGIGTDMTKRKDPTAIGTAWLKLRHYYDLVYHRLKQHWIISCVAVIATIVGCSLGIGWAFRLRTFNIADPDNMSDSMVQLHSLLSHSGGADAFLSVCAGSALGEYSERGPIRAENDLGLGHRLQLRGHRMPRREHIF